MTQLASYRETDLTTAGRGLSSRNRSAHEPAKKERGISSCSSCRTLKKLTALFEISGIYFWLRVIQKLKVTMAEGQGEDVMAVFKVREST